MFQADDCRDLGIEPTKSKAALKRRTMKRASEPMGTPGLNAAREILGRRRLRIGVTQPVVGSGTTTRSWRAAWVSRLRSPSSLLYIPIACVRAP